MRIHLTDALRLQLQPGPACQQSLHTVCIFMCQDMHYQAHMPAQPDLVGCAAEDLTLQDAQHIHSLHAA